MYFTSVPRSTEPPDCARPASPPDIDSLLPSSDLVKALHAYAADFYAAATDDGGKNDWRSMDETALLALGVLMEEMTLEALGETGDLALAEGEWVGEEIGDGMEGEDEEGMWVRGLERGSRKVRSVVERRRRGGLKSEDDEGGGDAEDSSDG